MTDMGTKKKSKAKKILLTLTVIIAALVILFLGTVFLIHTVKSHHELELLKEKGYYNPVSVGEYSLNVAKFGNENGSHTIIGMAGLGTGDFDAAMRQTTECLEKDNLVVFVDRAGYGLSDDTNAEMTLEYIVADYRKALKNAGLEPPYILLPHSMGGAYATYWVSKYPEEIRAVVFIDGSELSENAFEEEEYAPVSFTDTLLAALAKMGFSRFVLHKYNHLLPDNFSDEEQELADALAIRTLDSIAPVCEAGLIAKNGQAAFNSIVTNDVPKLYICSSWGIDNWDDLMEWTEWCDSQIEKNGLEAISRPDIDDEAERQSMLDIYETARQDVLFPYLEKMGNCRYAALGGDHMIYLQKPRECGEIIKEFIDGLE